MPASMEICMPCVISCFLGGSINGCEGILPKTPLNHSRKHNCHEVSEFYLSGYILVHFGGHKIKTVGFMRHFQRSLKIY